MLKPYDLIEVQGHTLDNITHAAIKAVEKIYVGTPAKTDEKQGASGRVRVATSGRADDELEDREASPVSRKLRR